MKRQNIRTLSLVVCTFTYLLIGAAVFDALESETEARRWEFLKSVKANFVAKYNITPEDYHMIEIVITENKPHKAGPQWKFAGAFYFATVVLAMIGYGHSTPVTIGGKAFCMAYAMVGIPLGLVMFQSIGERLNKFASVVIRRAKKYLRCQQTEATEMNLMLATGLLSSVIITTGAAVFSKYEGWSYFDSFYYCFVTLTTIGFGDYVALQNDQALINKPGYVALSLVFILFGLAVVAASINLLVLRFMTMNAEDIRREEAEMQSSVEGFNYECESTGKLLSCANLNYCSEIEEEDTSVCSCTCLGGNSFTTHEHEFLLDQGYHPADIITSTISLKRMSI
ncbi:potassium channel subfamily K member 9 isoform X1 [Toxorhynchites rutilus septentrionalis]|uniref:potassium channel subfamily K member 9 isoform X1 n=1 Tax=Toxorhynchites rutilus septentrionalis TaxID=329112 RepID=UPI002478D81B|nr:potassium channel subfamily K member 9 isoform X1 [Toxorhynchites rutilus septentrionalis]